MSEAASAFAGQEGLGFWFVTAATAAAAVIVALVLRRIDWL
jgi:hypothetical protein